MASQFATQVGFRHSTTGQNFMQTASYRERGGELGRSSRHRALRYRRLNSPTGPKTLPKEQPASSETNRPHRAGFQGRKLKHPTGNVGKLASCWCIAKSTLGYLMMKAKMFYDGFCCDILENPSIGNEAMGIDPYFSIPVIPATS